ncbi:MAG: hypothetical protein V4504_00955 [Patescibacteria group bacterium]
MNSINKTTRISFFLSVFLFSLVLFSPVYSFAQSGGTNPVISNTSGSNTGGTNPTGQNSVSSDGKITNPIKYNDINSFIKAILAGVLKIGIPIIALAIIYSGFLFVSARGNSEKLKTAKDALLYTCIGAAILLGSWALAQLISETILAL